MWTFRTIFLVFLVAQESYTEEDSTEESTESNAHGDKYPTEFPVDVPWQLKDDEEMVTDQVGVLDGNGDEVYDLEAYEAFDNKSHTSVTLDPVQLNGRHVGFLAIFYTEIELKGVRVTFANSPYNWVTVDAIIAFHASDYDGDGPTAEMPKETCIRVSSKVKNGLRTMEFNCMEVHSPAIVVMFQLKFNTPLKVMNIQMFGHEHSHFDFSPGVHSDHTSYFTEWGMHSSGTPYPSSQSYQTATPFGGWSEEMFNTDFFNTAGGVTNGGYVTWAPQFKEAVPYKAFMNKQEKDLETAAVKSKGPSLMGFLSEGGYIDFIMAEEEKAEDKAKKEAKKEEKKEEKKKVEEEGSGEEEPAPPKPVEEQAENAVSPEDSSKSKEAKKAKAKAEQKMVGTKDIENSIQSFQKFNGFPETGKVSREILEYVKKPRCGVNDVEFTVDQVKQEAEMCDVLFSRSILMQTDAAVSCGDGAPATTKCANLPSASKPKYIKADTEYTIDIDLNFKPVEGKSWDDLVNNFAILFNWDGTTGDKLQLFASEDKFGFQYTKNGVLEKADKYEMTSTQKARRDFKIRVDVEKGGSAYLLINGQDVGEMPYTNPLRTAVHLRWAENTPKLITTRLCKRPAEEASRSKRAAASTHRWGTNDITFNFQNYSTILGMEKTREGVLGALNILKTTVNLKFVEKTRIDQVMLTLMFIRGKHADGLTFHGAGAEKAHAYSPVHSEIHFNDYEQFSLVKGTRMTSMMYVALHEIGHALGLKHSDYRDAVMAPGYDSYKAFHTDHLHRMDSKVLKAQYPGEGEGDVKEMRAVRRDNVIDSFVYAPKLPLPRECFTSIDAAFTIGTTMFLISNTFIWRYKLPEQTPLGEGVRVSDVLAGWNYITRAAFTVENTLFLVSDSIMYSYTPYGSIFMINSKTTVNVGLNTKNTAVQYPMIWSAFTLEKDGKYVTTLVTGEKEYYKLTWKNSRKLQKVEKVEDTAGTSLLGKTYAKNQFQAAVAYEREKKGVKTTEIMKFDGKYVKSVNVYHAPGEKVRKNDPYQEIPQAFNIGQWCAAGA